jgi:hypothetical protein
MGTSLSTSTDQMALYVSHDGGASWHGPDRPPSPFFVNADTFGAYAKDSPAGLRDQRLIATSDGGTHWTQLTLPPE